MLKLNITEKSNASYYSQVTMTPKKDGSWCFCADYRNMNDCTEPASWPVGKGDEIVARIGYHQAAMPLAARVYTAFTTYTGIYQFIRSPFGLE
jgi:hypothetical protein